MALKSWKLQFIAHAYKKGVWKLFNYFELISCFDVKKVGGWYFNGGKICKGKFSLMDLFTDSDTILKYSLMIFIE